MKISRRNAITGTNPYCWTLTDSRGGIILNKYYNTYSASPDPLADLGDRGRAPGEREGGRGGSLGMPKSRVGKPTLS